MSADPNMPEAYLLSGRALLAQKQFRKATSELTKAVELDEKLDSGWYWLGVAAEAREDYQQAQVCYGRAMNLKPENVLT